MRLYEIAGGKPRTKEDVEQWLIQQQIDIKLCTINEDLTVDVEGDVDLHDHAAMIGTEFNVKFRHVWGNFECGANNLTTLEGFAPTDCLKFKAGNNLLTSFKGVPGASNLFLKQNKISSFEGIQNIGLHTINLTANPITSLIGIDNHLRAMSNVGLLSMNFDEVVEGGLGLVNIRGLKALIMSDRNDNIIDLPLPFKIIHAYLGKPDEIFECQEELIKAGYEDIAQL